MWVRFVYDAGTGGTNFAPGDQVEVPDGTAHRWQLIYELFIEAQIEMQEFKARGWSPTTRALPTTLPIEGVS